MPLPGCVESTPAVWKGRIYVGNRDGFFYAIGDRCSHADFSLSEGEVLAETNDGVVYTLRFGEILTGQDERKETKDAKKAEGGESRYLFVTASAAREAGEEGRRLAQQAGSRFAEWYYVISGADFSKLKVRKKDLGR